LYVSVGLSHAVLPSKSRRLQVENLDGGLRFFEPALVLVRLDDVVSRVVKHFALREVQILLDYGRVPFR
jgi:hypothetical protein